MTRKRSQQTQQMNLNSVVEETDSEATPADSTTDSSTDNSVETPSAGGEEKTGDSEGQVSLTDVSYEGHTVEQPPENRVTVSEVDYERFFEVSRGDVLWVDGREFTVIDRAASLIGPAPVVVISKTGEQARLVAGDIPKPSVDAGGAAWYADLVSKDRHEISRSDLICSYDRVYILEQESFERLHRVIPDTDERACPACGRETGGDPVRIERQAGKTVEIRKCTDTDCKTVFRFVRDFPESSSVRVLTFTSDDEAFSTTTIDGGFIAEEQDDFKFPLDTHDGRTDGFYSARETAEFINKKLASPELAGVVTDTESSVTDILDALSFVMPVNDGWVVDENGDDRELTDVSSLETLYEAYVADRVIPYSDDLASVLDSRSRVEFIRVMMFLRRVIPDASPYNSEPKDGTGFDVDSDVAIDVARIVVEDGSDEIPETVFDYVNDEVADVLRETMIEELSVEDVLESRVFYELVTEHTSADQFGVAESKDYRKHDTVVEWRDAPGFSKKMRQTFRSVEDEFRMNETAFQWQLERTDLTLITN